MNAVDRLFLVGPMGAGKTTIGRLLARELHLDFVDSDHEIQARTGVDIPTIFEYEGESGFREREAQVIDDLTQRSGIVLATGGGVVMTEENRRHLASRGPVFYLNCSPRQQYDRTRRDKNRPLLQTPNPLQTLTELFERRDPLYRDVATHVIMTDGRNAHWVMREIVRRLNRAA